MNNRAGEMEAFALAAELGSFSAAGRRLGLSPSAVSKLVARVEDRLGARLLLRSTRALRLTPEGEAYLARAQHILAEIDAAERAVASGAGAVPRGKLRVSASVGFGVSCVVPLVPAFLALHPAVQLDLSLSDGLVDLVEDRTDIAIRSGPLRDSALKARLLMRSRRVIVAAPAYLARQGVPERPQDLMRHNCLGFNFRRSLEGWPFRDPGGTEAYTLAVPGNVQANNGATHLQLCRAGLGLARLGAFHVEKDIAQGRLVPVLEPYNAGETEEINALHLGHAHLAARIRAFIDFLARHLSAPHLSG